MCERNRLYTKSPPKRRAFSFSNAKEVIPHFAVLPGVKEAMMVETPYKLINKEYGKLFHEETQHRIIKVGSLRIGEDEAIFIALPCAVESKQQILRIAEGG